MTIDQVALSLLTYWVNGILATIYWIMWNFSDVVSIAAACIIVFWVDPFIQNRATSRIRRYGRGEVQTGSPASQYLTIFTIIVWVIVSQLNPQPIPFIGMVMWIIALIGILAVSEQRFNQLWWAKAGILSYAAIVVLLRVWTTAFSFTNAADWASFAGTSADAQVVLQNTRSNVVTLAMLFEFFIYPLGYAGLLLNKLVRNPKPLFSVFTEPGEVLRRLRVRQ